MSSEKGKSPPRSVLLCRTDRLGDVILALPCAKLLKRLYPGCRVGFLVRSYPASVVEMAPDVDVVHLMGNGESVNRMTRRLKSAKYDVAIALFPDFRIARVLKSASVPLRAGIAYRWYSVLFNYRHREHRKLNVKHEVEYNLSLTYNAFRHDGDWSDYITLEELFPLNFRVPEEVRLEAETILQDGELKNSKLIAIHPGGGGSAHRWSQEKYCELVRDLRGFRDVKMIITGGIGEERLCRNVSEAAGARGLNLCGKVSLPVLAELYRCCHLVVTNSTGPLHLARAVGARVLGLFPNDPAMSPIRWGPFGMPDRVSMPPSKRPMSELAVSSVFEKIDSLLK